MDSSCCFQFLCTVNSYLKFLPSFRFSIYYAIAFILCAFVFYYKHYKCAKLTLRYADTKTNNFIVQNSRSFKNIYNPTPYLANGIFQTMFYVIYELFTSKYNKIKYDRELIHLQDGGQISLDWVHNPTENKPKIVIVILPGLCGCKEEFYVKETIWQCISQNLGVVVINQRGLSGTPVLTPKLYCGCTDDDTYQALKTIKAKCPEQSVYAIGFSMGANILTNVIFAYVDN